MMKKKNLPQIRAVFHILGMVDGFGIMISLSAMIRVLEKLGGIFLAAATAFFVESLFIRSGLSLVTGTLVITGIIVLRFIISYFDTYVSHDVSFKIVKALQNKMYRHMDSIAPGGLIGINSADSATLILSDISVFEWFVAHCLVEWIGAVFTLFVCIFILCRVSCIAAVIEFLLLVLMMAVPFCFTRQAGEKGLRMKKIFGELNGVVADGVLGHKDIIAFHYTDAFFRNLNRASENFSLVQSHYAGRSEWERTWESIIACIAVLAGTLISSAQNPPSFTHLIVVFAFCNAMVNCIQGTLSESTNFGFVFGAAERMMNIFSIEAPVKDTGIKAECDIAPENKVWNLSLKHVSYHYQDAPDILKDISFRIQSPEVTAIVAASGEGKSTLAKLLQRFWDVDSGCIYINDTDIREISLSALRNTVMVIPQETFLFCDSIRNNLLLADPNASDEAMANALQDAQALRFIEQLPLGLDTVIGNEGLNLSGGERQRIALARAFLKDPPILILDEATSALDTENERSIVKNVKTRREQKITLVIAHRISSMQSADRIIFIKDGKVYSTGTYTELMEECSEFRDLVRGEYSDKDQK